jgi:GTP pyrophosphokinase
MVRVSSVLPLEGVADQPVIDAWLAGMAGPRGEDDIAFLRAACETAAALFGDSVEPTGQQRCLHRLHVAEILNALALDSTTLAAAILHGVGAAPGYDEKRLRARVGDTVVGMLRDLDRIGAVAAIGGPGPDQPESEHTENLRRMLLSIAEDVRVVLVVLAERLQAMRTLKKLPPDEQVRIARETRDIYSPLANRLGIWQIKWELEDLSLRYLAPDDYKQIAGLLEGRRGEREAFIGEAMRRLQEEFARHGIEANISGRPKHIFSIWRKMQRKGVDFDRIFDVRALRVLVDSVADCYAVLGIVHGLWPHIPGEFDDYIATPKTNMYRSLHTAVIGPDERPLEVQIRTYEMHDHAERGVASHWRYKEDQRHDGELERRVQWMRHWLELKEGADDPAFLERFKSEFQPERIYVLTPQGRVVELPRGGTPLDFAYAIHTDIGHRCRGAKVDGRIVPLTQALHSGQTVEILTAKEGGPSRDWLSPHQGYLKTAKALNRVRAWFKQQDYELHAASGRAAIEREVVRLAAARPDLDKATAQFNFRTPTDLYAAIGRGEVSAQHVVHSAQEGRRAAEAEAAVPERPRRASQRPQDAAAARGLVIVEDVGDLMTHMARCCKPLPADPIVGYITRGRGVTVHRRDCRTITEIPEDQRARLVAVRWNDEGLAAARAFDVDVLVVAADRKGLLRDVSSVFSDEEVTVVAVHTQSDRRTDQATMRFTAEITDLAQLRRIMARLDQLPDVIDVRRGS